MTAIFPNLGNLPGVNPDDRSQLDSVAGLTPAQQGVAQSSMQNYLKGTSVPAVTANAKAKTKAAIGSFNSQIQKAKATSAKLAKTAGKTGKAAAAKSIAGQQANKIGSSLPGIASFLPPGTNLNNTTFDEAINTMQAALAKLQQVEKVACVLPPPPQDVSDAAAYVPQMSTPAIVETYIQQQVIAAAQIQPQKTLGGGGRELGVNANVKAV
jgi:hypothetical protein